MKKKRCKYRRKDTDIREKMLLSEEKIRISRKRWSRRGKDADIREKIVLSAEKMLSDGEKIQISVERCV